MSIAENRLPNNENMLKHFSKIFMKLFSKNNTPKRENRVNNTVQNTIRTTDMNDKTTLLKDINDKMNAILKTLDDCIENINSIRKENN